MKTTGKLIILEGVDGSGKKTQTELLVNRIEKEGYPITTTSFPQYGKKSAGPLEEYLVGAYGGAHEVSPKVASLFFAIDRYDKSFHIKALLRKGMNVVLDRYVDSNAGHQGGKISDDSERETFLQWLYDIEYGALGVPHPDCVIVLHLPVEESQLRIERRAQEEQKKVLDIHEADANHLAASEKSYVWIAKHNPSTHHLVECMDGARALSREEIHKKIWTIISRVLTEQSTS